jgi:hypothetical protein
MSRAALQTNVDPLDAFFAVIVAGNPVPLGSYLGCLTANRWSGQG